MTTFTRPEFPLAAADRAKAALNFIVMVDGDFTLAAHKFNIFFWPWVNGHNRPRVHPAAIVAMTCVDKNTE
jgi:hypothetical protein